MPYNVSLLSAFILLSKSKTCFVYIILRLDNLWDFQLDYYVGGATFMPFVTLGASREFIIKYFQKGEEHQSFGVDDCPTTV